MKVAYVLAEDISFHGTSGASAHVRNVVEQLEERGHSVELVSRVSRSHEVESEHSSELSRGALRSVASALLPRVIKAGFRDWRTRRGNRRLVQKNSELLQQADLIYERDAFQSFGTQRVASRIDTPWVLECNGFFWEEESPLPTPVSPDRYRRRHVEKWEAADQLIVVSESFKTNVVQEGVAPEKISVIHNGVNLEPYREVSSSRVEAFRKEWGLNGSMVVGFLGHMLPWHRIDLFVDAIGALRKSGYNVQGLLVGGGRWKKYRTYADQEGLAEQIVFSGPVPPGDVPEAVAAMDVCTAPGVLEPGSPVKLFDYGAAGKPVVATNASSVTEIITDEENGLLFNQGSLESLLGEIVRFLENEELRYQLGSAIRAKVEKEHTWEKVGERTEKVLQSVARA